MSAVTMNKNEIVDQEQEQEQEQVVTPWKTSCGSGGFDYQRLIKQFGVQEIDVALLNRFEKVTGHEPHIWMKRGHFFAHRGLDTILTAYENGEPIMIYTGRGPTSDCLHLGHMVPISFTVWLQKVFNAVVVFQMADDEKYWFRDMDFDKVYDLGFKNARDIIACGFDLERTFIFSNRDFASDAGYKKVFCDILNNVSINQIQSIFGIEKGSKAGQLVWPVYQTTAAFSQAFNHIFNGKKVKCLVAYAIDQDPYFRMARDVAPKLGFDKPCSIMCTFLPALAGTAKMSSTGKSPTVYMDDEPQQIMKTVKKYAFSGGRETLEQHRELGGDLSVDISYQYLRYFMEDDKELEKIAAEYSSGSMLSGEIKKIMATVVSAFVEKHKRAKEKVTDQVVQEFFKVRSLKVDRN